MSICNNGFEDARYPSHVCKLQRAIYGLKQSPRGWYARLSACLHQLGFTSSKTDTSMFIFSQADVQIYSLVLLLPRRIRPAPLLLLALVRTPLIAWFALCETVFLSKILVSLYIFSDLKWLTLLGEDNNSARVCT
jgi:hypothetical protein